MVRGREEREERGGGEMKGKERKYDIKERKGGIAEGKE